MPMLGADRCTQAAGAAVLHGVPAPSACAHLTRPSRRAPAAAHRPRALPGPLGELAARELSAHAELAYLGAPTRWCRSSAAQVLALPARPCLQHRRRRVAGVPHAFRRAALRGLLRAADVEALLVTDLVNVRYLTGFTGSNASLLVHVDGDAASRFCTDGRYVTQSAVEVPDLERVIDRAGPVVLAGAAGRPRRDAPGLRVRRGHRRRARGAGRGRGRVRAAAPRAAAWWRGCGGQGRGRDGRTACRLRRCGRRAGRPDRRRRAAPRPQRARRRLRPGDPDARARRHRAGVRDHRRRRPALRGAAPPPDGRLHAPRRPREDGLRGARRRLPLRHDPHRRARPGRGLAARPARARRRRAGGRPGGAAARRLGASRSTRPRARSSPPPGTPTSSCTGWATASACRSTRRRCWARRAPAPSRPAWSSPSSRGCTCPAAAGCASRTRWSSPVAPSRSPQQPRGLTQVSPRRRRNPTARRPSSGHPHPETTGTRRRRHETRRGETHPRPARRCACSRSPGHRPPAAVERRPLRAHSGSAAPTGPSVATAASGADTGTRPSTSHNAAATRTWRTSRLSGIEPDLHRPRRRRHHRRPRGRRAHEVSATLRDLGGGGGAGRRGGAGHGRRRTGRADRLRHRRRRGAAGPGAGGCGRSRP